MRLTMDQAEIGLIRGWATGDEQPRLFYKELQLVFGSCRAKQIGSLIRGQATDDHRPYFCLYTE